ncbi:MAG: phosphoribosylformylglycinamidine cyclo-ligase [Candidatus Promineifilaceae bacterium]
MSEKSAYARAGVDLQAGHDATKLMSEAVKSTHGPQVLSDVGSFGGLYTACHLQEMLSPVLVASTDGVGTKTMVAARAGRWDTIGQDIVNHCLNDILVQGARPLFFLDYVASARLDPFQIAEVVKGVAAACRSAGVALLGGETAEMPGVYRSGELDLVGTIVGVVEREQIIDGSRIEAGDLILGLPSSGLHTNGYTLARAALDDLDWSESLARLDGRTVAEALLTPHRSYLKPVSSWLDSGLDVRGLAHITGGGLVDNPLRILPPNMGCLLHRDAWQVPPIFNLIQQQGDVSDAEMAHVFNLGLGMLAFLPHYDAEEALRLVPQALVVGETRQGAGAVIFDP